MDETTAPEAAAVEAPVTHVFVADERTAARMARAALLSRGPVRLLAPCLVAGVAGSIGAGVVDKGLWWLGIVLVVYTPFSMQRNMRKQMRATMPAGARITTEFRPETFVVSTDAATSESRLDLIEDLKVIGDCVVFQGRNRRIVNVFPRAVFPDHEVERIRALTGA